MKASQLINKDVVRKEPVNGDFSFQKRPVKILEVTPEGQILIEIDHKHPYTLDQYWNDDNWEPLFWELDHGWEKDEEIWTELNKILTDIALKKRPNMTEVNRMVPFGFDIFPKEFVSIYEGFLWWEQKISIVNVCTPKVHIRWEKRRNFKIWNEKMSDIHLELVHFPKWV